MIIQLPAARNRRGISVSRLGRARNMLCETLERRLTIAEVAREAALSPCQFIRTFRAVFGETPHQVRIHARLELAKRMLATGDDTVTEICEAAGFASLGTFSHLFARRIGASPSAFRRQLRAQVQVPEDLQRTLYPGCFTLMAYWPDLSKRNFQEAPAPRF
jgi:AraC-like DNA-binding protein